MDTIGRRKKMKETIFRVSSGIQIYIMDDNTLHSLLANTIGLYEEYISVHDYTKGKAGIVAILEVIEGYRTGIELRKNAFCECQNCDGIFLEDSLALIEDLHERVEPGEPMPAGQCPMCGSLCHRMEVNDGG
jgi:hypothetical protein